MEGPLSSYSCLEIHICWNVDSDARMEPPIHTEYFLSAGAIILIFVVDGASEDNSFTILSPIPARLNETLFYLELLFYYLYMMNFTTRPTTKAPETTYDRFRHYEDSNL